MFSLLQIIISLFDLKTLTHTTMLHFYNDISRKLV